MSRLWNVSVRHKDERYIQLESRCFQYRNVTNMSYVNKDGGWCQCSLSEVKAYVKLS
jgi:hypothetical protein